MPLEAHHSQSKTRKHSINSIKSNIAKMPSIAFLPSHFGYVGLTMVAAGAYASYLFVYLNQKPDWLTLPAFTVWSQFIVTHRFELISNNYGNELVGVLLIAGLWLLCVSKQRTETDQVKALRVKSLVNAFHSNTAIALLILLFLHGITVLAACVFLLVSMLLLHVVIFRIRLFAFNRDQTK